MPKKDESSGDEFMPSGEEENSEHPPEVNSESETEEQEDDFDPYQPRKAKLNRKNIVESEDSDKLSTDPDNSDEYDPEDKKSKIKRSAKHADSDSDGPQFTPSPKKKRIIQRKKRPPRRKPVSESDTEDSASTATESDEAEASEKSPAAPQGNSVVDQLQAKFLSIPRADITRVYYQSSCQFEKAVQYLTNEYSPSKFSRPKPQNGNTRVPANGLSEESDENSDEDENDKTNLQSDEDKSEDEKPVVKSKRKALNSSDEEWCPAAKKQKTKSTSKSVSRRLSSSDDDEKPQARAAESDMSDGGVDDDYSEDERPNKRSAASEKPLLKFLNTATAAELAILKSFSDKKVELMIELRPFSSFLDIRKKIDAYKNELGAKAARPLNSFNADTLADSIEEFLKGQNMVLSLLKKCESMGKSMTRGLEQRGGGMMTDKPSLMADHLKLKDYQKRGLHWYTQIHKLKIGGILADEMGLGKTVQTISFFAWLKEHHPNFTKPHLVVCPSSTMDNWKREFECWLPSFKIFMYHGEDRRHHLKRIIKARSEPHKAEDAHKDIDVIITTYTSSNSHEADRVGIKKLGVGYAIFDEGHMLKNMNTNRYQQLMRIGARRRVLLTGTPLQNNLLELVSLIKFLMPDLLQKSSNTLQRIFKLRNQESEFAKKRVAEARTILQPFILRRVKSEVLKDLPPKISEEVFVDLTDEQRMFYEEIKGLLQCKLSTAEKKEQGIRDIKGHFVQLRKVANHPLLHRSHYTPDILRKMSRILCERELKEEGNVDYVYEDLECLSDFQIHETCEKYASLKKFRLKKDDIMNSGKFKVLDELLPKLFEEGHRVLLFSQFVIMMDIMERYLTARKIKYMRLDGSTPVEDRLDMIDTFNADSEINLFMVSTRAGGLGINLTSADTVIIHDIDPNPYNDKQAEDRCHRVGQTKQVNVIRLIVKDTIEVRMRKLAVQKLNLESKMDMNDRMVYNGDDSAPKVAEDEDSNDVTQAEMLDLISDSPKAEPVKEELENESMKVEQLNLDSQASSTKSEGDKEPLREVQPNGS